MSEIKQLIERLCPDGVEYKRLGEVCQIMNGKDYKNFASGDIPVYGTGGVMTYIDTFAYDKPSVLLPRKGSIDKIYYVDEPFWTVDTIYWTKVNETVVLPKFLYYYISTVNLAKMNTGTGAIPSLTQAVLKKIEIPVPPLEVQRKIVEVLDNFTELEVELEAELEARRKQYEYYRNTLLSFDKVGGVENNVKWMTLGEIAEIGTGSSNTNEELDEGKYPFFVRSQVVRYKNEYEYDETAIITSGDGVGVGKVFHYIEGKYALHQRAYRIKIKTNKVNSKFFYYYMRTTFYNYIMKNAYSSSVTSVRKPMLIKFPVPIPPLSEQQRIVSILDRFEALTTDLQKGLPAEIAARRKQYEYYREKLLTFKRKTA